MLESCHECFPLRACGLLRHLQYQPCGHIRPLMKSTSPPLCYLFLQCKNVMVTAKWPRACYYVTFSSWLGQNGIGRTLAHPYSGVMIVNDLYSPTLLIPVLVASLKEPGMISRGRVGENFSIIDCILAFFVPGRRKMFQVSIRRCRECVVKT